MKISFSVLNPCCSRLDRFIASTIGIGRRKVNYLFSKNKIFLNGKKGKKSDKVIEKSLIELFFESNDFSYSNIKIIKETDDFIVIYKPPKIHSQEIFKSRKSVENFLKKQYGNTVKLLNRLDYFSQGLMIASKNDSFFENYKKYEKQKQIEKYYLCFVNGKIFSKITVKNDIDYEKRKKVKVLESKSNIIETQITPVGVYDKFSIVIAKIFKGARHQIRAHLSYIGYPLIGDNLYGNDLKPNFFLYCFGYKCKKLNLNIFEHNFLIKNAEEFLKNL